MDTFHTRLDAKTEVDELVLRFPRCADSIKLLCESRRKIGNVSAPDRSDRLSKVADSNLFGVLVTVATLANCVVLTYCADWQAVNYSSKPLVVFFYIDLSFLAFFILEIFVRLWRHRWYYFYDTNYVANWIDFTVVVGGALNVVASQVTYADSRSLQLLRTLRLVKVLRVLRVVSWFRTLHTIFQSLATTLLDLFWCAAMLAIIQYMFALVFVMRIGAFLHDESETLTPAQIEALTDVFGSMKAAMFSLFLSSMGGDDWGDQYSLVALTGVANQVIYLFFVIFSFVAVLNVMLGIFVEKAMKNLQLTREERAREHAEEEMKVESDLMTFCREADDDGDGALSLEEWDRSFSKGKMSSYMDLVGFRSHDLRAFFELCAARTDDGKVSIEVFVRGCMRMRGFASCYDVQTMIVELHSLNRRLKDQRKYAQKQPP